MFEITVSAETVATNCCLLEKSAVQLENDPFLRSYHTQLLHVFSRMPSERREEYPIYVDRIVIPPKRIVREPEPPKPSASAFAKFEFTPNPPPKATTEDDTGLSLFD